MGSVIKKRRKKMSKHKYRKMLKKTRWQRRHQELYITLLSHLRSRLAVGVAASLCPVQHWRRRRRARCA